MTVQRQIVWLTDDRGGISRFPSRSHTSPEAALAHFDEEIRRIARGWHGTATLIPSNEGEYAACEINTPSRAPRFIGALIDAGAAWQRGRDRDVWRRLAADAGPSREQAYPEEW